MNTRDTSGLYLFMFLLLLALLATGCDLFPSGHTTFSIYRTPQNLLFIKETDFDSTSEQSMTDMLFAPPEDLGANEYTLQQSLDGGTSWNTFQDYGEDLITTDTIQDNFSINLDGDCLIRLAITGGPYDGTFSNEVEVIESTVDTYFSAWSISQGGGYFAVSAEEEGTGIDSSFTVKNNTPDYTVVDDALTYQWYRFDPDDFEVMIPIAGATETSYTTTGADSGYIMVVRATGDGVHAGGYCQIMEPYID
ncbi:MAG: hypothetical protein JXK93_09505 [Sphaerochaetaceae bacterium]|nr:hypothetical protein [Sphaerochaetaceae bacterium]